MIKLRFEKATRGKIGLVVISVCAAIWLMACSKSAEKRDLALTVVHSNDMIGNIRSCGCVVKDYGGLGRQATLVRAVKDTSENFLLLEGGDFFSDEINYGKEKAEVTMKAMALMEYHGVVVGEKDFSFGLDFIRDRSREIGLNILVSNLFETKTDKLIFPPKREVVLSGGLRVALIGVMSRLLKMPPQVGPGSVRLTDPVLAVRSQLETLGEDIDLIIVLAHMSQKEAMTLAKQLPGVDLVINGHEGRPMRKVRRFGNAFVLQVPKEGKYMGLAYCKLDSQKKIENLFSEMEALDKIYEDDEAIIKLFAAYDMNIIAKEKAGVPVGVAAAGKKKRSFIGVEPCRECHEEINDFWEATAHAFAFDILVSQSREFDRDCTPCHTTGFYKEGGFVSLVQTPELINVQCESCHGNGHDHSKNPKIRTMGNAKAVCTNCHTPERSADFSFEESWPKIRH